MQPGDPVVLVVEDDRSIRVLLEERLQEGYVVETYDRGMTGLARLDRTPVDVMVLDLKLPDLDGLELCQRVRACGLSARTRSQLPIIVLSAHADEATRAACFAAGVSDYLAKPFDVDELLARQCLEQATWHQTRALAHLREARTAGLQLGRRTRPGAASSALTGVLGQPT